MQASKHKTLSNLHNNLRFYILCSTILVSVFLLSWLRAHTSGDQLFYIRTEQVFGFMSIGYWYTAILLSPLEKAIGKQAWLDRLTFGRRALGVSAAYFAFLHAVIAFLKQMGGWEGVGYLPAKFQLALALGLAGLIVLIMMAATSFDKVVDFFTYPRWKWIHRTGYLAGVAIIFHVWLIGTHTLYGWVQLVAFIPLAFLFMLEGNRIGMLLGKRFPEVRQYQLIIAVSIGAALGLGLFALPRFVDSYHSAKHSAGYSSHGH